jgi:7,8-dihydropterin-6-yl-methyl-4-(beta-D-ribofuranosyl)aminobenzene 5'-phosphate synthase
MAAPQIVRITVLAGNTVRRRGLLAEHGLAFWIEALGAPMLMDAGQGLVLAHNARALELDLGSVEAVFLSHGHDDHTAGVALALAEASKAKVYGHPGVLEPKYRLYPDGAVRSIGMSEPSRKALELRGGLFPVVKPMPICSGLRATGEVPRVEDETDEEVFFLDPEAHRHDSLLDDQALFFDSVRGTVVLLGCAHAGVINTLMHIRALTGDKPIHAVVGGMHLKNASTERIDYTIESLRQFDIERIVPLHCTGMIATMQLWKAFPGRCEDVAVGDSLDFEVT